jgi:ATP-dependent protease HslVU (ClpYQ) peptidase subunit
VTVCIAAMCDDHIVMVSDMKVSAGGYFSLDIGSTKQEEVHPLWRIMFAGDVSQAEALISNFAWEIVKFGPQGPTLENMAELSVRMYQEYRGRLIEEGILGRFSMSLGTFLESRERIGDRLFEQLWADISRIRVGCDLLVCGYSSDAPHIFTVTNPTEENPSLITHFDDLGFAAIGSGAMVANSALYASNQFKYGSLEDTLYKTTFAKFAAESSSDVGETTFVRVFDTDGMVMTFDPSFTTDLRKIYLSTSIPPAAVDVIKRGVANSSRNTNEARKAIHWAAATRFEELSASASSEPPVSDASEDPS